MEIESLIKKKKKLYIYVLGFLESESNPEGEFESLAKIIDEHEIVKNQESILEFFRLLYKIGDNHHRTSDFFNRFGQVFEYLTKTQPLPVKSTEIIDIYKANKRLLLLLFEYKVIIPDESIIAYLNECEEFKNQKLNYYLFPVIKEFLEKSIEKEILHEFNENIDAFESKIKEGENDSPICKMIRKDSIQEFVSYVNQTNLPLTSTIKADFYESNPFLIKNEPSLIEYAFFYGSIQVIKYLQSNHVEFTPKIWQYAVHSNNPELIDFLEEKKIRVNKECILESIKCHHNDIADYIIENLLDKSRKKRFCDEINQSMFESCNYFHMPDDITSMISNPNKEEFRMKYLASSFTSITIPSSITKIGENAFYECSSLIKISIPSSVTSIGNNAFSKCSSLVQIEIPSSITLIRWSTFNGCSSLTQITIPSSVTSIGNDAFKGCSSLTQISIPSSVTEIGNDSFFGCSSLMQITIPSSVTSIGNNAFDLCSSLTQITIPSSVTSIRNNVFSGCTSLTQILIPSFITSIGDGSFFECSSLTNISIPSSVTSIGNYAFYECSSLTKVSIPSSVTSIGNNVFDGCSSLTQILFGIPSSLTKIGYCAFEKCISLTQIIIPSSVVSIGENAFLGCSSLTKISIPSSVISIKDIDLDGSICKIGLNSKVKKTFT